MRNNYKKIRNLILLVIFLGASIESAKAQFIADTTDPEVKIEKIIFSIGYNTSWRLAKTNASTEAEKEYFKNLKRGGGIRFKGLVPLGDQSSAVGITYSNFGSKTGRLIGLSEAHDIYFVGGVYQQYNKFGNENQHIITLEYSLGYMGYQSMINGFDAFKGGNIAGSLGGSYRLMVSPVIGIGLDLNLEGTTVNEWTAPNGQTFDLGEPDNLFRISLGFGVDIRL